MTNVKKVKQTLLQLRAGLHIALLSGNDAPYPPTGRFLESSGKTV